MRAFPNRVRKIQTLRLTGGSDDNQPLIRRDGGRARVPDGLEWVNTDRALTMEELKGKIVILDFWTYC